MRSMRNATMKLRPIITQPLNGRQCRVKLDACPRQGNLRRVWNGSQSADYERVSPRPVWLERLVMHTAEPKFADIRPRQQDATRRQIDIASSIGSCSMPRVTRGLFEGTPDAIPSAPSKAIPRTRAGRHTCARPTTDTQPAAGEP
ncbi:hypothetical protein BX604_0755 [Burkholderia sp. JKS000303]|nr:hypothetical protein BX604_0755 [Burkholderia sp. JKS000303]